jgi:hypothetical protein
MWGIKSQLQKIDIGIFMIGQNPVSTKHTKKQRKMAEVDENLSTNHPSFSSIPFNLIFIKHILITRTPACAISL